MCRLKTVSVSNVKLESGEVGWNNKVDVTEGLLEWVYNVNIGLI